MRLKRSNPELSEVKWICVDCFDTLLHRICTPEAVLNQCFHILARNILLSEKTIKEIWELSRREAKQRTALIGKEEPTYDEWTVEFYSRLMAIKALSGTSLLKFKTIFSDATTTAENQVIVVNEELVVWLIENRKKGKKIACLSDFYMSGRWLQDIMQIRGLGKLFDKVIVSSDIGLRKSTGHLYQYALDELDCTAYNELLMIGDNVSSDYHIPEKLGIHALLVKKNIADIKIDIVKQRLEQIYARNRAEKMPFCNYIFSIYLFCDTLLKNLKLDQLSDVWFFSREGKILKYIFEEYLRLRQETSICCHYIYISRQATFLPSLSDLETEDFYALSCKSRNLSINDFLESLGFSSSQFSNLDDKYDFEKQQEDFFANNIFQAFKREPEFVVAYERARLSSKEDAVNYFQSQGLCTELKKKYAIVDIGWKGSIQDCLSKIFDDNYSIHGYYYGLIGDVRIRPNNEKKGLVFSDFPIRTKDFEVYSINYRMLERLLYADHGCCLKYEDSKPVLKYFAENEEELFRFVNPFQENLIKELEDIVSIFDFEERYGNSVVITNSVIRKIHTMFSVDVDAERFRQMDYMNKHMEISFASFGIKQEGKISDILCQLRHRRNKLELVQKTEFMLYKMKLGFLSQIVRTAACRAIKHSDR